MNLGLLLDYRLCVSYNFSITQDGCDAEAMLSIPTALVAALHPSRRMCSLHPESRSQHL
jgi:hypothetical protein